MHLLRAARFILAIVLALSLSANHVPFGIDDSADAPHRIAKKPISYEYVGLSKSTFGKLISSFPYTTAVLFLLMISILGFGRPPIRRLRSCHIQRLRRIMLSNIQFSANYL
jgi:hypothetical protein